MLTHFSTLGFFGLGNANPMELMILGIIALLLFGKRLPEVAKSLGKGIVEFKKGLSGVEEEIRTGSSSSSSRPSTARRPEAIDEEPIAAAPRFEPPKSEPAVTSTSNQA